MNYPVWEVSAPGLLIAVVAVLHVFISHFAVGGGLFLVVAERKARRDQDAGLVGFVRSLSRAFVLLTLVLGALTGVGIWFTIGLVQPQATSALVTIFVWAWAVEWTFFAVEIAAAMVYDYGWDRLSPRTHLQVGWIYFASAWASLVAVSGILAFMLTSGEWVTTRRFADGFFNPTFLPMVVLRTAIAAGLAGLYALLAASFLRDGDLKARVARWSASRFIVPAALVLPLALAFYLSAAAQAGAAVAETLGARAAGMPALLSAVFASANAGHPVVREAARVAVAGALLLVLGALVLAATRARRYHPIEAGALMLLGLAAIGGSEWVREGLRKPWVIDRYMLVDSVRVPAPPGSPGAGADPFALDALARRGVLASSLWIRAPAGWRPGEGSFEGLAAAERADLEAAAGREVFRLECTACHTQHGHLAIAPLVRGKSVAAIETLLDALAKPVSAAGRPVAWSDPSLRLATWLGRRMPPFVGTSAERRALAIHLARLGGDAQAGVEPETRPGEGREVFETYCSPCHGPDAQWPISERLRGRGAAELYDLIGRLPQVREEMPPFAGTEDERRALARYLASLEPQAVHAGEDHPAGGEEVKP
jgi:mono/diheme cytochrome c family protein